MEDANSKVSSQGSKRSGTHFFDPQNDRKLRVWVGSIPSYVEANDLLAALKQFGVPPVTDIVFRKYSIRSWGFLTFRTSEEAAECINLINGKRLFKGLYPHAIMCMQILILRLKPVLLIHTRLRIT
ncbi:bifunctional RNA recognition motif domain/RNA-binding domain superfamily/Nucleotide-binding alpha-beta plait domain superfamily [Babesia duncani]|uniref:Bifunctional RNA recognition motif domain/RNA-binding domain superfamily/Nucleotide-binding alpha-beta plait domain superfamily n=1 Tax=Babesia duncani TaxID=323732 RepID=A0AAD9PLR5_9APIC|nr:bifunctional RNA recognition motif domain/RNA-binding domain superfamily/Nucleotide-binding alpha-beta plait domain superfamily [Babesia duncani]